MAVPAQLQYGTYYAGPGAGCQFSTMGGTILLSEPAAQAVAVLPEIAGSNVLGYNDACGAWTQDPVVPPEGTIPPGMWLVSQLTPGRYVSTIGDRLDCQRRLYTLSTTPGVGGLQASGTATAPPNAVASLTLGASTTYTAFWTPQACGTWTREP